MTEKKMTPMMTQWHQCKEKSKSKILLFRMGDFYEAFYEDAEKIAASLDIVLTKRQDIPMAGIPVSSLDNYLDRLIAKGFSIAIAEQLEDPKKTKGIVKRDVVRVVSPGTLIDSSLLDEKSHNYFASLYQVGKLYGLAKVDLSCGEFTTSEWQSLNSVEQEIAKLAPKEILTTKKLATQIVMQNSTFHTNVKFEIPSESSLKILQKHFEIHTVDSFGIQEKPAAVLAATCLLNYLKTEHHLDLKNIQHLGLESSKDYLHIDCTTENHLELVNSKSPHTLFSLLDATQTGMGGRLLKQWLLNPLYNLEKIKERQDFQKKLHKHSQLISITQSQLAQINDLERLISKIAMGYSNPKDFLSLGKSLEAVVPLKLSIASIDPLGNELDPINALSEKILNTISHNPSGKIGDGTAIQPGIHKELDEYRKISTDAKQFLREYQDRVKAETGIKNLKVNYNRMFGYYVEVSRGQAHLVPSSFERRQTLVNQERYITEELKEFEQKVFSAEDKIAYIEKEIFQNLVNETIPYQIQVINLAKKIAYIDVLVSLAHKALQHRYVCPNVNNSKTLEIKAGRHPVIETLLDQNTFVPNETSMDDQASRLFVITGPNMAGKSTYIRQVALIVIMAQMGAFVPAEKASIGLIDRIFTRIGAQDDLTRGQSTFMVEMTETAFILNNATDRSLIVLDEIGRGTSTYDGISIAWSVAEYLLTQPGKQAKTLFATHYWELTKLEKEIPGACNLHSAVKETEAGIIFTRKVVPGGTDKSYGVHVARLAGLPAKVIARSHDILQHLEETSNRKALFKAPKSHKIKKPETERQLLLF